jgi:hypothetical protein
VVRSDAGKHKFTAHIPKYLYQNQKLVLLGFKVVSTDAYPQALAGYDNVKLTAQFNCNVASCVELDFEKKPDGTKLGAGAYVLNEWLNTYGLRIETTGGYSPSGKARIFDTSNPGTDQFTGDPDLGSPNEKCAGGGPGIGAGGEPGSPGANCEPLGNVLIIQESNKGNVDDNSAGGTISFNFAQGKPVKLEHIGLLDMDKNNFDHIEVYTWKGEHKIINFQGYGKNSMIDVIVNIAEMKQLVVYFVGSGAVAEVGLCLEEPSVPIACSSFEHRFESSCNIGYFDVDGITLIASDTATVTFELKHEFTASLSPVAVWVDNPNTPDSKHFCWAGDNVAPGVMFGNTQYKAKCENGWAAVSIAAGNDKGNFKLFQDIHVVEPFCQAGAELPDFDSSTRCYWELQIPCNPACNSNRRLGEQGSLLTLPASELVNCKTLSKAVDMYNIPVDHCVATMTEDPITIVSQDGDTIKFTVTKDCNSNWFAADYIASDSELVCHKTLDCVEQREFTAKCVDGATIVDLYAHGHAYKQADGSPLVIPKACDASGSDNSLCHFRYILKCKPSKCEKNGKRQPAASSVLFSSVARAFGWT